MAHIDLRPFIGGGRVETASTSTMASIDPSTEQVLWHLPIGDPADIDLAVTTARRAFSATGWAFDPALRVEALLRLADVLVEHTDQLAQLDTTEVGIPIGITTGDVGMGAGIVRDIAALIEEIGADTEPPARRVPRGVIGVLAPWNFPFFVALTKVVPALAAGNCVVLKPTELASASALLLAELFHEAGLPAGVLAVVPGRGEIVGEALVRHRGVDQLNLTGSTTTGRRVLGVSAATTLVPVVTELGGKSPQLVGLHAPDLDLLADAIAQSIFWAAGQVCTAGSRLIVPERLHDELVERLVSRAAQWQPGDPQDPEVQAGPLASEAHLGHVTQCVHDARADGGRVLTGGERMARPGWFFPPTIVDDVEPHHRLFSTEVFGPVLAVTSYRTAGEGIELANDTAYGLMATGWSNDHAEAEAMANGLRAAWVNVNPHVVEPLNPRVGAESIGWSGSGVEGGLPALRAATRLTVVQHGRA